MAIDGLLSQKSNSTSVMFFVIHNGRRNHPNQLDYRKICARWVPMLLTEEHTANRMDTGLDFLFRYHETGEDFLNQIVTGDEKWVHHFTPR